MLADLTNLLKCLGVWPRLTNSGGNSRTIKDFSGQLATMPLVCSAISFRIETAYLSLKSSTVKGEKYNGDSL